MYGKPNYKVSMSKGTDTANTYKQKTNQANMYHLDSNHSVSAFVPTMMQ
jgi:hypothetical protein